MNKWCIRLAVPDDLEELMKIFNSARCFMESTGNTRQWINGYPQRELITEEIARSHCYVIEQRMNVSVDASDRESMLIGTFCFMQGEDSTYAYIEQGRWLEEHTPYAVIHRVASAGKCRGVFETCLQWAAERSTNLRVDTHADNLIMQRLLEKNGFIRCGIIYVANGTSRIAYQRITGSLANKG